MVLKHTCTTSTMTSKTVKTALSNLTTPYSSPQASKNLYSCRNWTLGHSWLWNTPLQPPWWSEWLYLIFPALIPESTSIAQYLQLWKLGFMTFLVLKDACTTFTTLIFLALKHESTSMKGHLRLWKWNFITFLVLKNACPSSLTVRMTLSDLPSTESEVDQHCTTSTVVEIGL